MSLLPPFHSPPLLICVPVGCLGKSPWNQAAGGGGALTRRWWGGEGQGIIQSAFLWGYMATPILGGTLADQYGGKLPSCMSRVPTGPTYLHAFLYSF